MFKQSRVQAQQFLKAVAVRQYPEVVCLYASAAVLLTLVPHAKYLDCPSSKLKPQTLPATSDCYNVAYLINT